MKLSEAIRLGAMNKPQAFGNLWTETGKTCALGAAADAIGLLKAVHRSHGYNLLRDRFPILSTPVGANGLDLCDRILKWNDVDEWTREQIADAVEQIELAQEAKPVEDVVVAD